MAMVQGMGYSDSTSMLNMMASNMSKGQGGKRKGGINMAELMQSRSSSIEQKAQLAYTNASSGLGSTSNSKTPPLLGGSGLTSGPGSVEVKTVPGAGYGQGNMVKLPNYTKESVQFDYLSKSNPAMSEKEFEEAIKKLAEKNAAAGIDEDVGDDYFKLAQQYVSVVSPDRKAIIAGAKPSTVPSGLNYDIASAYDDKGQLVATYNPSKGWSNRFTAEEKARNEKFDQIYWNAYNAYVKEHGLGEADKDSIPSDAVVDEDEEAPGKVDVSA